MENINDSSDTLDYIVSFESPVETDFFTPDIKKKITALQSKLVATVSLVKALESKPQLSEDIDKEIMSGNIYAPNEAVHVEGILSALEGGGSRIDTKESVVSPTGQRIIMSGRLQNLLGFSTDGYILKQESDKLTQSLQADGVPGPEIDKVNAAINKYGAVLVQRGVFIALKDILEQGIGRTLTIYNPAQGSSSVQSAVQTAPSGAQPRQGEEMPAGFIEYLKNNDKEFDRVEHEITQDPKFQEFFANLQKHYAYYQKLPADRMAHEIILRPQLWVKLSPQTKVWVQNLVERNRESFQSKVAQVATAAGTSKLDELKKTLGK